MPRVFLVLLLLILNLTLCETQEEDEFIRMKRTSCYLITRNYLGEIQNKVIRLVKDVGQQERQKYISKLFGAMGQMCEDNISESEVQEFYIASEDFQIGNYFYVFQQLDLVEVFSETELTPKQLEIVAFQTAYEQNMKKNSEQQYDGPTQEDF